MSDMIHLPKISIEKSGIRAEIDLRKYGRNIAKAQWFLGETVLSSSRAYMPMRIGGLAQHSHTEAKGRRVAFPGALFFILHRRYSMAENKNNVTNLPGQALEIVVDDGSVEVLIRNKQGDTLGVFYFRPTDMGLIDRYNQLAGDFGKITAPLENLDINPDGTADGSEAAQAAMKEAEQRLMAKNMCQGGFWASCAGRDRRNSGAPGRRRAV